MKSFIVKKWRPPPAYVFVWNNGVYGGRLPLSLIVTMSIVSKSHDPFYFKLNWKPELKRI